MKSIQLKEIIINGALDEKLSALYGKSALDAAKKRFIDAVDSFTALYGDDRDVSVFTVAGRSELSGNHTDHNRGCVVAASISLDIIAIAAPTEDQVIRVKSEGFDEDVVKINEYTSPDTALFGTSSSIIAGMCACLREKGFKAGGFVAYTTSSVLKGSGLSSSAAFEDMIGTIESHLYNNSIGIKLLGNTLFHFNTEFKVKVSRLVLQIYIDYPVAVIILNFSNSCFIA